MSSSAVLKDPAIGKRLKSVIESVDPIIAEDQKLQKTLSDMKQVLLKLFQIAEKETKNETEEIQLVKKTSSDCHKEYMSHF